MRSDSLSILEKVEQAHRLFNTWGKALSSDSRINELLQQLRPNIENSQQTMWELGVVAQCKHCEEEEGGSCCGAGIEDRYSVVLLLINLLLGVRLKNKESHENSCYFLRENGCSLMARHVLCVNYLCARIRGKLAQAELTRLQESTGDELNTTFLLHETIKKFIAR